MDNLENKDIILTNSKYEILNNLKNKLLDVKIMNKKEFIDEYFGKVDERSIYYLVKEGYTYEVAKMYLDNFLFDEELYNKLDSANLIIKNPLFKKSFNRLVLHNIILDNFYLNKIDCPIVNIDLNNNSYKPKLYKYKTIEDEINHTALSIISLLNVTDIKKIHLVNVGSEYEKPIKRIFSFYNIPINLNCKKSIYGTKICSDFISMLDHSLEEAVAILLNDDVSNAILDVVNKYRFAEFDETIKYIIIEELKTKKISLEKLDKAVDVKTIDEIDDEYYFILNCNQGSFPKIYKDEDYLSDKDKKKIGLLTSLDLNIYEKNKTLKIIHNYRNIKLSYIENNKGEEMYKSSILTDLKEEESVTDLFNKSNIYNKLRLASYLDDYIKFNLKDENLEILYNNYKDIPYLKYDNKYKTVDKELFKKYINNTISLSYTSLDNFYKCQFRYYLNNVLKLEEFEEKFSAYLGSLFHHVLQNAFTSDFDFDKCFNDYIKDKEFNNMEKFFINKLRTDLLLIINVINEQDSEGELNESLYEENIRIDKSKELNIVFKGFVDKIKYSKIDKVASIIDYKTGTPVINLNNCYYGLDLQLPIYLYLLKHHKYLYDYDVAGFYLQHILPKIENYKSGVDYEIDRKTKYKLQGYSNSNVDIISKFDKTYTDSKIITSLKITKSGEFYSNSKILSNEQMDNLVKLVDKKIDEAIEKIEKRDFEINPKVIDKKNGCDFCPYKDICYKKEEDIKYLDQVNYKEFLGGEENA